MGFTFNGIHSDTYGIGVITKSMPYIPEKRQTTIEIPGRDGQFVFEDGYNNIIIELACAFTGDETIDRRKKARFISSWLSSTGKLVLDHEQDVEYTVVRSTNNISAAMLGLAYRDDFTITFECDPYQEQTFYNDDVLWAEASSAWKYSNIPLEGYERKFSVSNGQTIDVINAGTYVALPVMILTGVAHDIRIGNCIFNNLNGTVYFDSKNKVVYNIVNDKKNNRMSDFSGHFIELNPGSNLLQVSGQMTTVLVEFDYKNTYL